jgi:hypothetical protein
MNECNEIWVTESNDTNWWKNYSIFTHMNYKNLHKPTQSNTCLYIVWPILSHVTSLKYWQTTIQCVKNKNKYYWVTPNITQTYAVLTNMTHHDGYVGIWVSRAVTTGKCKRASDKVIHMLCSQTKFFSLVYACINTELLLSRFL